MIGVVLKAGSYIPHHHLVVFHFLPPVTCQAWEVLGTPVQTTVNKAVKVLIKRGPRHENESCMEHDCAGHARCAETLGRRVPVFLLSVYSERSYMAHLLTVAILLVLNNFYLTF